MPEKKGKKSSKENMNPEIEKLKEENQRLQAEAEEQRLIELVNNQPRFNIWIVQEIGKIKDGINQLMEKEDSESSSEAVESPESNGEEQDEDEDDTDEDDEDEDLEDEEETKE